MSAARQKMVKARADLVLEHPFFATLALRLTLREDPSCATAWSDGQTLGYNPAYIAAQPLAAVKGMQCHEVLHLACGHHVRRGEREPGLWNRACDLAINPILLDAGLELPSGFLDDPAYRGKSADAIYAALVQNLEQRRGQAENGADQDATPEDDMEAAAGKSTGLGGQDHASASGSPESAGGDQQAAGGGGLANGPGDNPDPGQSGEVRDAPAQSMGAEGDRSGPDQEDEWRMALAQAARVAREAGNMPGSLERLLESMLAPRLGWRDLLRRFLTSAARNDFSWVRPNRRHIHAGLYLPGMDSLELEKIALVVDVSGSIDPATLDIFGTEVSAVLEEFDTELLLITCDVSLTSRQHLTRFDLPLKLQATGGGGTDFRQPFRVLDQDGIVPACLVYLTDLQCTKYPDDPGYPVLWVTAAEPEHAPPFGQVVVMEDASGSNASGGQGG